MLSTVIIILLITIIIGLSVYLIIKPKPKPVDNTAQTTKSTKPKTASELMDEAIEAFGIKVSDNFSNNVIFKTKTDVYNNFPKFSELAFPLIDKSAINKILKDYGIDKTIDQLVENINLNYVNYEIIGGFLKHYEYLLLINDENNLDYIRLYFIVYNSLDFLKDKEKYSSDMYLELSKDFKTSTELYIYIRTNLNKNIDKTAAVDYDNDNNCLLTSKLCYLKMTDFFKHYDEEKNIIINNKEKVINYVNYVFIMSLLLLNRIIHLTNLMNIIKKQHDELKNLGINTVA